MTHLTNDRLCRICMKSDENFISIFNTVDNSTKSFAEMICECIYRYRVNINDKLPKNICETCSNQLKNSFTFREKAEQSYKQLCELYYNEGKARDEIFYFIEKSTQTEVLLEVNKQENAMEVENDYNCEHCNKSFSMKQELDQHMQKKHNKEEEVTRVPCPICEQTFSRRDHMKKHIRTVHKEDPKNHTKTMREAEREIPLDCPICKRTFKRRFHLKRHITLVHKQDAESVCKKSLEKTPNHVEEKEITVNTKEYLIANTTDKNPISSDSEEDLPLITIIKTEPTDNFQIPKEEKPETLFVKVELPNMEDVDNSENDEKDKDFLTTDQQESDSESDDRNTKKLDIKPLNRRRRYGMGEGTPEERTCNICKKLFSRLCHLRRHMQSQHSENKPYSCPDCKKCFSRSDLLKNHVQAVHGEKIYKCDLCEKSFSRKESLQRHKKTPHGDAANNSLEFECELCPRKFPLKRYLIRHQLVHSDRIFACRFCEETYKDRKLFQEHERTHKSNEKNFLCSICGDSFVRHDYLRIHIRRHLGEKPFKCQYCGKGFPRKSDVKEHERYHTNTKPSVCKICGKAFFRTNKLTIHMRIHTGEKPYKCEHCSKCFAQSNDLKAHVRRHTGERFRCEQCDASFLQLYGLRQHALSAHGTLIESTTGRLQKVNLSDPPAVNLPDPEIPKTLAY